MYWQLLKNQISELTEKFHNLSSLNEPSGLLEACDVTAKQTSVVSGVAKNITPAERRWKRGGMVPAQACES